MTESQVVRISRGKRVQAPPGYADTSMFVFSSQASAELAGVSFFRKLKWINSNAPYY